MRFMPMVVSVLCLVSAEAVSAQDWQESPTYGDIELSAGFLPDPVSRSLTAGGGTQVDIGGCGYGYVAAAPDYDLYYSTGGSTTLYIYARSSDDTTLLINLPDGSWVCDDDGLGGRNPLVVLENAADGLYDIWVGTYGDALIDATLYVSEIDPRQKRK